MGGKYLESLSNIEEFITKVEELPAKVAEVEEAATSEVSSLGWVKAGIAGIKIAKAVKSTHECIRILASDIKN